VLIPVALVSVDKESAGTTVARAQSDAHPAISKKATIMDVDVKRVQKGTNAWVCMPGIMPGDNQPMCNDAVWGKLMTAVGTKADFKTDRIGISYMLQGD